MRIILNCVDRIFGKRDTRRPVNANYFCVATIQEIIIIINEIGMQLREMQVGHIGRIVRIQAGEAVYRQRLIAMGLIPGTEFKVSRIAPLGDPIEITVRGFALSLRKDEAGILQIEQVSP